MQCYINSYILPSKMAQQVKVLAANPDDLSPISVIHIVEKEK